MQWTSYAIENQITIKEFFTLFKRHYEDGYTFTGETHNFWECVYVLDGKLCVSADERVYNLNKGKIIFHKPLEMHKFYIDNPAGATLLTFSFTASGALCEFLQDKVFGLTSEQQSIILSMLNFISQNAKKYNYPNILERCLVPSENNPLYLQSLSLYITQLILSLAYNPNESSVSNHPDAKLFRKAVHFMNKNIYNNLSVEDIAKYCNTSISSIKRIFDKFAGIPVHQYFLKLKIQKATMLLKKGISVSDVAEKLSFCSQAYFSKAYKRETGHSPSELKHKNYT